MPTITLDVVKNAIGQLNSSTASSALATFLKISPNGNGAFTFNAGSAATNFTANTEKNTNVALGGTININPDNVATLAKHAGITTTAAIQEIVVHELGHFKNAS